MAHNNLGAAYDSQGFIDRAIEQYRIAVKLAPNITEPHFNLGRIYFKKGDAENARREFEKVLQINPQHNKAQKFLNSIIQKNQ